MPKQSVQCHKPGLLSQGNPSNAKISLEARGGRGFVIQDDHQDFVLIADCGANSKQSGVEK